MKINPFSCRFDLFQTGEIYYINRETGVKTTEDPRAAATPAYSSSNDDDDEDAKSDEYSFLSDNGSSDDYDEEEEEEDDDSDTGDGSSSSSSASPPHPSAPAHVLVAAGCKGCFMYFMVPKHVDACPKCGGGGLLHVGRNGCI